MVRQARSPTVWGGHAVDNQLMITVQVFPVPGGRRDGAHPAGALLSAVRARPGAAQVSIAITLIAALLLGSGFVLQQHAAEQAPKAHFLRLALIADLLRKRMWLTGIGIMVAGQLVSAWSVSHISLSLAEPLLSTNLLFALALAVPLSGERLRATELVGVVLLCGGVAALSVARTANSPAHSFASPAGWLGAAAIAGVALACVQAGRLRHGLARATFTGIAAGLVFGIADALTRQTVHIMDAHSFTALLTTWPGYSLIGANLVGLWLMESAFNTAPLHASLPGISAAEPAAGIVLGIIVFGDEIRISPRDAGGAGHRRRGAGGGRRAGRPRARPRRPAARPAGAAPSGPAPDPAAGHPGTADRPARRSDGAPAGLAPGVDAERDQAQGDDDQQPRAGGVCASARSAVSMPLACLGLASWAAMIRKIPTVTNTTPRAMPPTWPSRVTTLRVRAECDPAADA